MKIYEDGELTENKKCCICETDREVFYSGKLDAFMCKRCMCKILERIGHVEKK
ncbi:MAG TPA: hypothetical protein VFD17_00605 [Clostridia bacterium]|nr:hypothetical protein [Clostridia bacterium]